MNLLDGIVSAELTRAIGWTVLHFLWQGTLIAAAVGVGLGWLREKSASARYGVCGAGLALMLAAPLLTLSALLAIGGRPEALELRAVLGEVAPSAGWQRLNALLPWITLVWLSGFSLLQTRTWLLWVRAQRLKRAQTRPLPPAWQRAFVEICDRIGVHRAVRVVESAVAEVPMLIGWLSPVILVPTSALCGLTTEQLRAVLAHELAHVRRHDALVNLIQATLESLLFFHPAVWWLSDRMRVEREYCCDDVAVEICGDTLCYARALSTLENLRGVPAPAVASNGGSLMHRIFRLVGARRGATSPRDKGLAPLATAALLAAAFAAAGMVLAGGPASEDAASGVAEPAAEASVSTVHEPRPSTREEPTDEPRLRREIAQRKAALERRRRETELRLEAEARDRRRRDAARAAEVEYGRADGLEGERVEQLDRERRLARERGEQAGASGVRERALERLDRERAAEYAQQVELERARESLRADGLDSRREALAELERALRVEHDEAAMAERAAQLELERALSERRDDTRDRRAAVAELERALEMRDDISRAEAAELREELDRLRSLETEQDRGEARELRGLRRDVERQRLKPSDELSHEDLERELAQREAMLEELNHELARLRELIWLKKAGKYGRKQLKHEAADEKSRLKKLKKEAERKRKVEEDF